MSVEEDTELRDLVAQTLENKGILPKVRAELRANIFLALVETSNSKETVLKNDKLSAFLRSPMGGLVLNLIREVLEYLDLDFTLSVFDPETKYGKDYFNLAREKMSKQLNVTESKKKNPLLYDIILNAMDENEGKVKNGINESDVIINGNNEISMDSEIWASTQSPSVLNSTYTKTKIEENGTPISPLAKKLNGDEENEDSIDEDLISNKSSISENSSKNSIHTEKMSQKGLGLSPFVSIDQESKTGSTITAEANEIDLLTFTPVKEVKTKDRVKTDVASERDSKNDEEKVKQNSLSTLGDLPPLNAKSEFTSGPKLGKIKEIKAIIEQGLDMDNEDLQSSLSSKDSKDLKDGEDDKISAPLKSDRSQNSHTSDKSEKTETVDDDFDEDLSDLINSHTSSENQLTIDETVSKISNVDYVESI